MRIAQDLSISRVRKAGKAAWFNSRIFAGDKSGVAGVGLETASEPQRASLGSGGVALRASTPGTPEL